MKAPPARVHLWYGVIFLALFSAFGAMTYRHQKAAVLHELDAQLERRAGVIASALGLAGAGMEGSRGGGPGNSRGPRRGERGFPEGPGDEGFGERRGPPPNGARGPRGRGAPGGRGEEPGGGDFPPPPPDGSRPTPEIVLTAEQSRLFEPNGGEEFYFVAWLLTRQEFSRSRNAPADVPMPKQEDSSKVNGIRARISGGEFREAYLFTPPGECLLAGSSMAPVHARLSRLAWLLWGGGFVLWAVTMAGGWALARSHSP